jgi:hypothetical protein
VRIRVRDSIGSLADRLYEVKTTVERELPDLVRSNAREGNAVASEFARVSSGTHARLYPDTFSAERIAPLMWEYGPESRGQGHLAPILENGSRNNRAHNNLTRSADIAGAELAKDLRRMIVARVRL